MKTAAETWAEHIIELAVLRVAVHANETPNQYYEYRSTSSNCDLGGNWKRNPEKSFDGKWHWYRRKGN